VWWLLRLQPFSRAYGKPFAAVAVSALAAYRTVQLLQSAGASGLAQHIAGAAALGSSYLAAHLLLHLEPEDRLIIEAERRRLFVRL
jgi:hypothetical protein